MTEYRLSRADVDDLGSKLATLEADLTEGQRALLAGLLRISRNVVGAATTDDDLVRTFPAEDDVSLTVQTGGPLPSLKEQFSCAFAAGPIAHSGGAAAMPPEGVTTSVGIGVKF